MDHTTVYLGKPGDSHTYIDGARFPYRSQPGRIGIFIRTPADSSRLHSTIAALGLPVETRGHTVIVVAKQGPFAGDISLELHALRSPGLWDVGPIFARDDDGPTMLFTETFAARGIRSLSMADHYEALLHPSFSNAHPLQEVTDTYLVTVNSVIGERINDLMEMLMNDPRIESVSALFFSRGKLDK